jgi:outer membrane protein assembly factor BamD (BamD/ComL family)
VELVWDRVQTIHDDMRISGTKPTVKIYVKTIATLVQCRRIDKAHEFFTKTRSMFAADDIPGSLLAYLIEACRYTKDYIRAQGYMDELLQLYSSETRRGM